MLELKLAKKQEINHVIIQEDIKNGERIRKYRIEAFVNSKWEIIANGSCIGQKRIQQFEPVTINKIRLVVEESIATPQIKSFSVYNVN
jgi:alpha-L-fucosidase